MPENASNIEEPAGLKSLRYSGYCLLIVLGLAIPVGGIFAVSTPRGESPFLSANDRSRWLTVRSLGDKGSFVIDEYLSERHPKTNSRYNSTIDIVRHRAPEPRGIAVIDDNLADQDGKEHYYSSKPPLLSVLVAAKYWTIKQWLGSNIGENPFYYARLLLVLVNVVPLLLYFLMAAWLTEQIGTTNWGRLFTMAAVCLGTYLTTFAVTLNNHLPAAIGVLAAMTVVYAVWSKNWKNSGLFIIAGFAAGWAAANELPALAFFCLTTLLLLIKAPFRTLLLYVPSAAVVAAAFFAANWVAHDSWIPPYIHRGDGEEVASLSEAATQKLKFEFAELEEKQLATGKKPSELLLTSGPAYDAVMSAIEKKEVTIPVGENQLKLSEKTRIVQHEMPGRWVIWDPTQAIKLAIAERPLKPSLGLLAQAKRVIGLQPPIDTEEDGASIRRWNNWYDYRGSYWNGTARLSVDKGEASKAVYAFHMFLGHHGIFSLTPVFVLVPVGMVLLFRRDRGLMVWGIVAVLITVVVLAFYITRPEIDRNYGGVSVGLRWSFWLIPLWLAPLIAGADLFARSKVTQVIGCVLLFSSCVSMSYGLNNPWKQPWLFEYWKYLEFIDYDGENDEVASVDQSKLAVPSVHLPLLKNSPSSDKKTIG